MKKRVIDLLAIMFVNSLAVTVGAKLTLADVKCSSVKDEKTMACVNAIDGVFYQNNINENSCFLSNDEPMAWLEVDLLDLYDVTLVKVYNAGGANSKNLANILVDIRRTDDGIHEECGRTDDEISPNDPFEVACSSTGRYVRVQRRDSTALVVCEIIIYGRLANLRQVTIESVSCSSSFDKIHNCSHAIDGVVFQNNILEGHCWSSNADPVQYITMDLGHEYDIENVQIFNRGDHNYEQLGNFYVLAREKGSQAFGICGCHDGIVPKNGSYVAPCPVTARYLQIKRKDNFFLSICEVKVIRRKPSEETCKGPVDIAFTVDISGSLVQNFEKEKDFLKQIIASLDVAQDKMRVSLVVFNNRAFVKKRLGEINNNAEAVQAIDDIDSPSGGTYTHKAIASTRENLLSADQVRPGIARLNILLTDGASKDSALTIQEAKISKDGGIIMVSVGIGNVHQKELHAVASYPDYAMLAKDFESANVILEKIIAVTCQT